MSTEDRLRVTSVWTMSSRISRDWGRLSKGVPSRTTVHHKLSSCVVSWRIEVVLQRFRDDTVSDSYYSMNSISWSDTRLRNLLTSLKFSLIETKSQDDTSFETVTSEVWSFSLFVKCLSSDTSLTVFTHKAYFSCILAASSTLDIDTQINVVVGIQRGARHTHCDNIQLKFWRRICFASVCFKTVSWWSTRTYSER